MSGFPRDIPSALKKDFDLIVIGGGIYGIHITLEASRRGLKALLLERDDFGGATSLNSLRILHGGLRYLQTFDLPRFFESVQQRRWIIDHFPELCRALPCIMPLYGNGLKRLSIMRLALAINTFLTPRNPLPPSQMLSKRETLAHFPLAEQKGLQGSALWHDAQLLSPQRLHAELLRWAARCGATTINYIEARKLITEKGHVTGLSTNIGNFKSPIVINATGPWAQEVSDNLSSPRAPNLLTPSLAFNVLLDKSPPSDAALAIEGESIYFVTPHQSNHAFVGTIHQTWKGQREPDKATLVHFINDLNKAIPGWDIAPTNILRVTAGIVPSQGRGNAEMAHRSVFHKQSPRGLFSVCGNKYTTAQAFATDSIKKIFGRIPIDNSSPMLDERSAYADPLEVATLNDNDLREFMFNESVETADDLMERRIDWIFDPQQNDHLKQRVQKLLSRKLSTS